MKSSANVTGKTTAALPADMIEALDGADAVKVESLVQDFLQAQSLKVLPQGPFGDAVNQFVSKDDKHAMELFVTEHLSGQVKQLLGLESDEDDLNSAMEIYRQRVEQQVSSGPGPRGSERKRVLKPKPGTWDSDFDGNWEDEPGAWTYEPPAVSLTTTQLDDEMADAEPTRTRAKKPPAKKAEPKKSTRRRKAQSEEQDVVPESDDEPEPPRTRRAKPAPKPTRATRGKKQTTLNFSQNASQNASQAVELSDDEISDDAFEPAPAPVASRTRRR